MARALIRVPETSIVKDDGTSIWIDFGDSDDFVRQVMLAAVNPDKAVVKRGEE